MSTQSKPYFTPEQYLEIERKAEFKSEYYQGEMFAMSGASEVHVLIAGNVYAGLHQQLRHRPCRAYSSDMRVNVSAGGLYTYPDVTVVCGKPEFLDTAVDTLLNPTVIIEVLSKSTESFDRGKKFDLYTALPSLAEYVLISSLFVRAERFTREPNGTWNFEAKNSLEGSIHLKSIDCQLLLADVYEKVDFAISPL
jgi:Uma2 family endonuclease